MKLNRVALILGVVAVGFTSDVLLSPAAPAQGRSPSRPPFSGVVEFGPGKVGPPGVSSGALPETLPASVGTNVRVNQDATTQPQNETTMAVNPINPLNLVAGANDYAIGDGDSGCGFYASFDGGSTWSSGTPLRGGGFGGGGDPAMAFDAAGRAYYSCLSLSRDTYANEIRVFKSTDGGQSWPASTVVASGTSSTDFHDKEYITADTTTSPFRNNIYVTWTHFIGADAQIKFSRSTNGGSSFSAPMTISDTQSNQFSQPAVGPNGEIYVSWRDYIINRILIDKSMDGGLTWNALGSDKEVSPIIPVDAVHSLSRASTNPSLAVDAGTGPGRGNIYLVWHDGRNGDSDILFTRSIDGGATWSSPIRVNDDPLGNGKDQFFPWINVEPDGKINIMWYDRRLDPNNQLFHLFFAQSLDGGSSFGENIQVSTVASDPCVQFNCGFIGDYLGMASSLNKAHPLWMDTRNGDQDVFTAAINTSANFKVTAAPTTRSVLIGQTTTYTVTVTSLNSNFSAPVTLSFDSPDRGITGTFSLNPVTPSPNGSASSVLTVSTKANTPAGRYTLTVRGMESAGETHSVLLGLTASNIDLSMNAVSGPSVSSGGVGSTITVSDTVCNQGTGSTGAFSVGYYLSADDTISLADSFLGSRSVAGLSPGQCQSGMAGVTIPRVALGTYRLGAIADYTDGVPEINEANNGLAGNLIEIVGADLLITAISGPTSAVPNTYMNVSFTVRNQGSGDVGPGSFEVAFYLSTDSTITTSDIRVCCNNPYMVPGLAAGQSYSATNFQIWVPTTPAAGRYYLGAIADPGDSVPESNETNNGLAGNTVDIVLADLVMKAVNGAPSNVAPGGTLTISDTVENQGATASAFEVGIFLSTDATITTSDLYLGYRSVPGLAAGASSSGSATLLVPGTVAAGTYYIGAIADYYNGLPESNENNNAKTGNTITVTFALPNVSVVTATNVTQTSATLNSEVNPNGNPTTAWFEWGLTTSYGNTTPAQDMGSGTSYVPLTATLTGLAPTTTYHFRAAARSASGTVYSDDWFFTTLCACDLVVNAVSGPASAARGSVISGSVQVQNVGTAATPTGFTVALYLSTDKTVTGSDPSDYFIGSVSASILNAGASQTIPFSVQLPSNLTGTLYLGAIADRPNAIAESNEGNNAKVGNRIRIQ